MLTEKELQTETRQDSVGWCLRKLCSSISDEGLSQIKIGGNSVFLQDLHEPLGSQTQKSP